MPLAVKWWLLSLSLACPLFARRVAHSNARPHTPNSCRDALRGFKSSGKLDSALKNMFALPTDSNGSEPQEPPRPSTSPEPTRPPRSSCL